MLKLARKKDWQEIQGAYDQEMIVLVIELSRLYLDKYPKHGMAWQLYGTALFRTGRYAEAKNALQQAIAHFPQQYLDVPYVSLGNIYEEQCDYGQAEIWYKKACDLVPDDAIYWIFLGVNYCKMGDIAQAENCARRAIACHEGCIDEA